MSGAIAGVEVRPGDTVQVDLKLSEGATHEPMRIPVTIARAQAKGKTVFVTSAIHGDEINGVAIVRRLLDGLAKRHIAGTVVAVPIVNRFGFDHGDRYLPDRRDLNRHFPGDARGNMAARIADALFRAVVLPSDAGIDLHTASERNTNLCHIRGDADDAKVRTLMRAFGTPIMVHGDGPAGSLRRAATEAGVPTILFEAGEPGRFERHVVEVGVQGIERVLARLGLVDAPAATPELQILLRDTEWVRSDHGGLFDLQVEPGDLVREGQAIGTITEPLGRHVDHVLAPRDAVVLGATTTPIVFPGVALVHLGRLRKTFARAEAYVAAGGDLGRLRIPA